MSKILFLVIGLVIGGLGGAVIVAPLVGGAAMGAGAGTGLSAGICATVLAAQEEGLLTADQIDQVLTRAATDLSGQAALPSDQPLVGGAAECQAVMDKLKAAAAG